MLCYFGCIEEYYIFNDCGKERLDDLDDAYCPQIATGMRNVNVQNKIRRVLLEKKLKREERKYHFIIAEGGTS